MICLAIGLGVLGFAAMRRARRCRSACGGPGYGWRGWHHHHRGHRRRWMVHAALGHLDASPAQERAIIGELETLEERVHGARRNLKDARGDLAAAVRGPILDDAALGAVVGRVDAASGEVRAAMLDALRNIHGLLDDGQRTRLAEMIDRTGGGGWHGGGWRTGPYR